MKAIILAAGRGTRMAPLTDTIPKPMLTVLDKNLIEWKLEALPQVIEGIILVVGYKKEVIENYFGPSWRGIPITYVEQKELNGTGGAIALCEPYIDDKALIMMGDDIYHKDDLEKLSTHDFALLVLDEGEEALNKKGQIVAQNGLLIGINEGTLQTETPSTLINAAAYSISKDYFNYPPVKFTETEYGLPHTLVTLTKDIPVHVLHASRWIQITSPECLQEAEEILR
jgi:UDP-N-acetylglucosamine diphosphorylase / glucose-1-phosphate thymidylyltransferase / UDP-N-acetylgalactosamine diphosphorylase / glucosamine-1-phosphate N-acetyltransferase / galactosamine-1-phosphate N-acetyltransferase